MSFWNDWSDGKKWAMGIVAALLIAAIVGTVKWLIPGDGGFPRQEVPFVAQSIPDFAVQSSFQGTAVVADHQIAVKLVEGTLSYPKPIGGLPSRFIDSFRVSLVKMEGGDGQWAPVASASWLQIARPLDSGAEQHLSPVTMNIFLGDLTSLAGAWLVFEIVEGRPTDPGGQGTSYAHTRPNLF